MIFVSLFFFFKETDCKLLLSQLLNIIESKVLDGPDNDLESSARRKRSTIHSFTRKKKFRSDSSQEPTELSCHPIDYLSLEPERIVSITRSRLPSQQLEFLLQCTHCPKKLFFISNEKAKELVPDLLIDFYERHINWFINKPTASRGRPKLSNRYK